MMDIAHDTSVDTPGKSITIIDSATPYLGKYAPTPFYCQGIKYKTLNHYIECQKALLMESYDTFHAINKANTPQRISAAISQMPVDYNKWYRIADDKVQEALMAKFSQNYAALSALISTGDSTIVYCDQNDGHWGNGLAKANAANAEESNWPGKNILGFLLTKVRGKLAANS